MISSEGTCYSYFTTTFGINWADARLECVTRGYDLATVTSVEENTLMYNTVTIGSSCWIGLHDLDKEGTFVWADGSDSNYRQWAANEPNNAYSYEDCVVTSDDSNWNDVSCVSKRNCYFCGTKGKISYMSTFFCDSICFIEIRSKAVSNS